MSQTPTQLAAAAAAVRALATALTADVAGLAAHSGPATWLGPAATAHRARAGRVAGDAHAVAAELARVADGLDQRAADALALEAAAARRRRERLLAASHPTSEAPDHG
ncbi:MAG TPA: hypothetical protein VFU19_21055 [Iamia sp.]|nr:hypothetical protein [Iamia sp.]